MDEVDRRVREELLLGAADAYGYRPERARDCSLCGSPNPAAEFDECDRPDCPLDGRDPAPAARRPRIDLHARYR